MLGVRIAIRKFTHKRLLTSLRLLGALTMTLLSISLTGCDFFANILKPQDDTLSFPVLITKAIPERPATKGETFLSSQFNVNYWGGKVLLSSTAKGDGSIFVDDSLSIRVIRPDGTEKSAVLDFSKSCMGTGPDTPQEVTDLFLFGKNTVEISLSDACGGFLGSSMLWLVNSPLTGS